MNKNLTCPYCGKSEFDWITLANHFDDYTHGQPEWRDYFICVCGEKFRCRKIESELDELDSLQLMAKHLRKVSEDGEWDAHFVLGALRQ